MTTVTVPRTDVRRLHRAADRRVTAMSEALVASVHAIRRAVTVSLVTEDIARWPNDPTGLFALLENRLRFAKAEQKPDVQLEATIDALLHDGAGVALDFGVDRREAARLATNLKVKSPAMQEAAASLTADLIQGVTNESKRAVRQIMFEAYRDGLAPAETAPLVRRVVGLTRGQAAAVKAREAMGGSSDAFADTLLRRRASVIARTETMRAANRGQQEAWRAMARDPMTATLGIRQVWITTPDDRLCDLCAPMDGKTVSLDSKFESTERGVLPSQRQAYVGETVDSPPLHPQCRCTLGAVFNG